MVSIHRVKSSASFRFVLPPNCSISWRELVVLYVLTCIVVLTVGLFFTLQGLWLVLPFSGLEMLVLGFCLYLTSPKVYRREVITLDQQHTRIEKGVRQIDQGWEFETPWISLIDEPAGARNCGRKLAIGSHGNYVEAGDFLVISEKDRLAFQLNDCIIRD